MQNIMYYILEPELILSSLLLRVFQEKFGMLHRREEEVQAILLNGEDMLARCREQDAVQLREDLKKLRQRLRDTKGKAERRKVNDRKVY